TTAAKLQGASGVGGDDRRQRLIADAQSHLGQKAIDTDLVDKPVEPVAGTQAGDRFVRSGRPGASPLARLLTGQQALDLGVRNPMMASLRTRRPDVPGMDPALEGGIADSQLFGCRSHRYECPLNPPPRLAWSHPAPLDERS